MAPLLRPEDCCILLIDPVKRNLARTHIDDNDRQALMSRHALVERAAQTLHVPKFFAIYREIEDRREWIARPCEPAHPRIYVLGNSGSLWADSGIGVALAQIGRACLVLCGFWLDGNVTFAALNALADGFDVFVLLDACPSSDRFSESPAINRLLQAGVVPLTTTQMVREWAEAVPDEHERSTLLDLLK
ncbi:MAG: isochorismatase family protein [Proteobacteria bacterium]|nr:isochorismatase family protein [Pseudomonadota bacterium]